ncbi:hypothetical protein A176_006411 [Myxococcus hansupus]|uniref:Uncharacterized protein n=1 Tax=Pseudomyxococcus hansupus TaxID=1297742 RepID=A0A0H4X2X6_9BACT|nr:hypothetical protein [Myxococcus hansupus]AKQ69499.1 hypothetical protein A176_006411 [Myxococcus hansupus]
MPSSTSVIAPDSPLRSGLIRAALLLTSVGTLATSEPRATIIISFPDHPIPPVTLTSQQGHTKRHVTVRIAPQAQAFSGDVSVSASILARWIPASPLPATGAPPTLHLAWTHANQRTAFASNLRMVEHDALQFQGSVDVPRPIDCEAQQECLWEADLEFKLEDKAPGRFEVFQWELRAELHPSSGKKLPAKDVFLTVAQR